LHNLQTDKAPALNVVVLPFMFGALSFLSLSVIIALTGAELLGPYFAGKMLAVTHLAVLGWSTMIVLGALYQLVPVVYETALFSESLARVTFWLFSVSIVVLVIAFWTNAFTTILLYGASMMFTAISLFGFNILLTQLHGKRNIQGRFVSTAVLWLLLTALLGLVMAFNFKFGFLSRPHLHYLKIHAHLGLVGWFGSLIIGVSSLLIPMFLVSHQLSERHLFRAFYLIHTGLAMLALDWWFWQGTLLIPLYWLLIALGFGSYLRFILEAYRKRLRKVLDTGMQYTLAAVGSLLIPLMISLLLILTRTGDHSFQVRTTTLYGFSIIFGLITPIILGQTYKTLPFIIWLKQYKELVGKVKTPLPKDLYSDRIGKAQLYLYYTAIALLTSALVFNNSMLAMVGSYLLILVALLYNINTFKIIMHKQQTESTTV